MAKGAGLTGAELQLEGGAVAADAHHEAFAVLQRPAPLLVRLHHHADHGLGAPLMQASCMGFRASCRCQRLNVSLMGAW